MTDDEKLSEWELERQWHAKVMRLYKDGTLELAIVIKKAGTNEDIMEIARILTREKLEHYSISKAIQHTVKDIQTLQKHEEDILIRVACEPIAVEHLLIELAQIAEAELQKINAGLLFFSKTGDSHTYILKEEEP